MEFDKATVVSMRLFESLPHNPILDVTHTMKLLNVSRPTAGKAIKVLSELGILGKGEGLSSMVSMSTLM